MATRIYYDGDCPFCARYTQMVELRRAVGQVELVNARDHPRLAEELRAEGFDLDNGMVFEHAGTRVGGAEAMHAIALLSTRAGWFNRINALLFSAPLLAKLLYPLLRAGRNAVLFVLGRDRLTQPDASAMSAFAIFAHAFGIYGFIDFLYHIYRGSLSPAIWVTGALGVYLALRPRSPGVFILLASAMFANAVIQAPASSNHAILTNFALVAMALAGAYTWMRGRSWTCFLQAFAPIGRALLVVMYVFGVFHKINIGFLDPDVSCAAALWEKMPGPLPRLGEPWFIHLAIYGTLIGESLILLGLLLHRTRHLAIIAGMGFHSMLALSGYGYYPAFSTLAICLHLLYLSPAAAQRIVEAPEWRALQGRVHTRAGVAAVLAWLGLLLLATLNHNSSHAALLWLPWSGWLIYLVGRYGRERAKSESPIGPPIYSRTWALNLISVAFLINCLSPYLGLKNAQAMNMFSNLTYEGGQSNHLIIRSSPMLAGYLDDIVEIVEATGPPASTGAAAGQILAYYDLLDRLDRYPQTRVSFLRNGELYLDHSAASLSHEIEKHLHPRWIRAWFHFKPLDLSMRRSCDSG